MFNIIQTNVSVRIDRNNQVFQTLDISATLKYDDKRQGVIIEDQRGRSIFLRAREVDNTQTFLGALIPFVGNNKDLIELLLRDFFEDPRLDPKNINLGSDDIANQSTVTGANVTNALDILLGLVGAAGVYGAGLTPGKSDPESTTTSQVPQNKLTTPLVGLVIGATYRIDFYYETSSSVTNRSVASRVQINGISIATLEIENKDPSNYYSYGGFDYFVAAAANGVATIDWWKIGGNTQLAKIRRARLLIYRVL